MSFLYLASDERSRNLLLRFVAYPKLAHSHAAFLFNQRVRPFFFFALFRDAMKIANPRCIPYPFDFPSSLPLKATFFLDINRQRQKHDHLNIIIRLYISLPVFANSSTVSSMVNNIWQIKSEKHPGIQQTAMHTFFSLLCSATWIYYHSTKTKEVLPPSNLPRNAKISYFTLISTPHHQPRNIPRVDPRFTGNQKNQT